MKRVALMLSTASLTLVTILTVLIFAPIPALAARPNVVLVISDDQRWDMVTPRFTPHIYNELVAGNPYAFRNGFVPNPLCCPSRVSTLTGLHSHATDVWTNSGRHGGFDAFDDDRHTIAVDFERKGYRTALIGKYLNGYVGGKETYVPPGWNTWFAASTSSYYHYGITTNHRLLRFDGRPRDYITRVLDRRALKFVRHSKRGGHPFFLWYAFTAPHGPSIPDPRDKGHFAHVTPADTGTPSVPRRMLESAYGVDRAVGHLLAVVPRNTVIVYMSDNGFLWGEHGLHGKSWPYEQSIRIPMIYKSLNGTRRPNARTGDMVLNIDLRETLTHAAGFNPRTHTQGLDWFGNYSPRHKFVLEHLRDPKVPNVPSYCGVRETGWKYVRYQSGKQLLFNLMKDPREKNRLRPAFHRTSYRRLRHEAKDLCYPRPPGYHW